MGKWVIVVMVIRRSAKLFVRPHDMDVEPAGRWVARQEVGMRMWVVSGRWMDAYVYSGSRWMDGWMDACQQHLVYLPVLACCSTDCALRTRRVR